MKLARFSRIGFILAAAGSAVGLGNIWKFPYITGANGGGAFVLIYLIAVVLIGFSIMVAEMLVGYLGRRDPATSFESIAPRHKNIWKFGGFQSLTGLFIATFYSIVVGWIFNYIFTSITSLPASVKEAEVAFTNMLSTGVWTQIFFHTIAFILITYIVTKGIKSGIEKANMILMPTLMLILLAMFFYAISLDAFSKAVDFMFMPDWSKLNSEAFVAAVGHAFFTLSLGMGAILTYSASMEKNSNLVRNALWIVFLDTIIAIVAGLTLFSFLYQYGAGPAKGPGLVFISLPATFYQMGILGNVFGVLFFIALAFAGLTSSVSIVEPMVQHLIDRFNFTRLKSALMVGFSFYLIGIIVLLSNIDGYKEYLTFGSRNLFDWFDYVSSAILLPFGGLITAIFIGFFVEKQRIESVLKPQLGFTFEVWYFSLRYITPVAMFTIMLSLLGIF